MAQSRSDRKPKRISVADAYSAIRNWYTNNTSKIDTRADDYGRGSASLIKILPPAHVLNDLEQRAILREVIRGYLEWGYHESDNQYKMSAYAHAAFKVHGSSYNLTQAEDEILKGSHLWGYLSPHFKK
jgi:hypothetical protein